MATGQMTVQYWADIRCPWCWIGHRRLHTAIQQSGLEVLVEHRSFLLEPDGPAPGNRLVGQAAISDWGLNAQAWAQRREHIEDAGRKDGLSIQMETAHLVDSRDAHRVLKLAEVRGIEPMPAWEAMFTAHLEHNRDLDDWETLARIGSEIGLDYQDVFELAGTDTLLEEVMGDHHEAQSRGFGSVPTLVRGIAPLSGSPSVAELVDFLRSVPAEETA